MPDRYPREMGLYYKFAKMFGWPPEVVRKLRRAEMFWLPVMDEAGAAASAQIQAMLDK